MSRVEKREIKYRYRDSKKLCVCTSKRTKEPCEAFAMAGKDVCYHHGAKAGRPITHGLYSKKLAEMPSIQERIEELKNHPELLDLRSHLAACVAHLEKLVGEETDDTDRRVQTISQVIDRISKLKEREHKIQIGYYWSPERIERLTQALASCIRSTCVNCPKLPKLADNITKISTTE